MTQQEEPAVLYEEDGAVAVLTLNRPQSLNSFTRQMHRDLWAALDKVEASKAIRADSLNTTTPILAMTANAFEEDRRLCLDAGMNGHIAKPVTPEKLYETLLHWLKKPDR